MKTRLIKALLAVFAVTGLAAEAGAQEYLPYKIIGSPTRTAPYYFGPSAFPVPDMVKNTTGSIKCQLNGDFSWGNLASTTDYASTLGFDLRFPLWTDRANLSVYGQFHEWYRDTPQVREIRRVRPEYPLEGNTAGDVYFSIDMRVLEESRIIPLTVVRVALKSASGDDYEKARYFDAPGYHFDFCSTKSLLPRKGSFIENVKASFNFGFVCWQTDIGCQNDAWLVAGSLEIDTRWAVASVDVGGYHGREHYHDSPTTLKARLNLLPDKALSPSVQFQTGLRDWPFNQVRLGLTYSY